MTAKRIVFRGVSMLEIERKNGKRVYRIDFMAPTADGGVKRCRPCYATKQRAADEFNARAAAANDGTFLEKAKTYTATLETICDAYGREFGHQYYYKTSKKGFIAEALAFFGKDTVGDSISKKDVYAFRHYLKTRKSYRNRTLSLNSVTKIIGCMAHVFDHAKELELLSPMKLNPFSGKKIKETEPPQRFATLTAAEIHRLVQISPPYLKHYIQIAFASLARPVDFLKWTWAANVREHYIVFKSKKQRKIIELPIHPALRTVLDEIDSWQRVINQGNRFESSCAVKTASQSVGFRALRSNRHANGSESKPVRRSLGRIA